MKINIPLSIISIVISSNILSLSSVLAEEKVNSNSNIDLKQNLKQSKNIVNYKQIDLNKSHQNQASLTDYNKIPTNSVFQLSSENQLPVTDSNSKSQVISQTPGNFSSPNFGEIIDNSPPYFGEVIRVDQLEDVSPRHWAYQALQSLVEKYRCLSDSGEGVFNGNRSMNRYEFAAALNLCMVKVGRSIYALGNRISEQREDLAAMERLQSEFAKELEIITAKIDNLEQRVALADSRQFSTTTVLRGGVNFNFISAFGSQKAVPPGENPTEDIDENITFSSRATLSFDTSFTGKDRLRTRIQAGNVGFFGSSVTGTNMTGLIGATNTGNDIKIGTLFYEFPIGEKGIVAIAPAADFPTRIFPALNPVSSISNFGAESPIYSFAFGAGAVAYYQFTPELAAGVTYLTSSGSNPDEGMFNGQYTALTQVTYTPSNKVGVALTYGRYYAPEPGNTINITGSKGSNFAQLPFGGSTATSSNALGLQFTYKLSDKFILGGWGSYFNANAESSPSVNGLSGGEGADADIWSWAITASLKDFGKLGSQLSFVFGMPPKVTNNDVFEREDEDTSLHIELSYRYPLNDRISITPGFLLITNPEHNADNDTAWVGLMRTSFSF
ncbi:MAG: iron uptake porin [Cyanobacteria bacterium J06632_19]